MTQIEPQTEIVEGFPNTSIPMHVHGGIPAMQMLDPLTRFAPMVRGVRVVLEEFEDDNH